MGVSNIFDKYIGKSSQIFRNFGRELFEPNYKPEKLIHREFELDTLAQKLAPSLHGETPSDMFIYGLPGTGKTITIQFLEKDMKEAYERYKLDQNLRLNNNHLTEVVTKYINCQIVNTQYSIFRDIAHQFIENKDEELPSIGYSLERVYRTALEFLDRKKRILILILDELDKINERYHGEILARLTTMKADLKKSAVSLILISNKDFLRELDPSIKSRLNYEHIVFKPYTAPQIYEILKQRAEKAFHPTAINDEVIQMIACIAVQEGSDVRRALEMLKVTAEVAERQNCSKFTTEHLEIACKNIDMDVMVEAIKSLDLHQKIVLYCIVVCTEHIIKCGNTL